MSGPGFWLVQRLYYSPVDKFKTTFPNAKVTSNPFGYGRLGDYALDYMGAAEFEFGVIPKAAERLSKVELVIEEHEYKGHKLVFMFDKKAGDPFIDWTLWAEGKQRPHASPFEGKEPPFGLKRQLENKPSEYDKTVIWWSLENNVMWSFIEPDGSSHLQRMLDSMESVKSEFLR